MKRIHSLLLLLSISVALVSCIKNDPVTFQGALVEFDAATWNSNNAYTPQPDSIAFPILTRRPAFGRAVTTADATLSRTSGTVSLRVNLVGAQRNTATEVNYTVITNYSLLGTPPMNNSAAVAGTHYGTLSGKVIIPADNSFGVIDVPILDAGAGTGTRELVLQLTGNADVQPNKNYKIVGLRISQQ